MVAKSPTSESPIYYEYTRNDALIKLNSIPDSKSWVSVSRDVDANKGNKAFNVFPLVEWLRRVTRENTHEYELLRGAVRLYVDMDWTIKQMGTRQLDAKDAVQRVLATITTVLEEHGRTVEGIALSTASGNKGLDDFKESFHAVFHTDKIFPSVQSLKGFMEQFVYPRIPTDLYREDGVCIVDKAPYGSFQNFRFLGQSKKGSDRVLRPVHGWTANCRTTPYMYLVGDYVGWPTWEPPAPPQKVKEAKAPCADRELPTYDTPPGYLTELCDLVPDSIIDGNETCFKFISAAWSAMPTAEGRDIIIKHYNRVPHEKEQTAEEYVDSVIARARSNITIGTLNYWAKEAHPKEYSALYAKYGIHKRDAMEVVEPKTELRTTRYSERHVKPFSFDDADTVILSSHLGTGKTTQTVNIISKYKRVVIVSGRKTFSRFIIGDLASKDLPFVSYLDAKSGPLSAHSRLVIQVESLWRLEDAFADYDFVIMDESETILNQLFSETTNRHRMIQNHLMLERIVKGGRKVLYADAFVSRRTLANAEMLRNPERAHYIVNEFCPYKRTAVQLLSTEMGGKVPAKAEFCARIMDDLANGKRVVVVWSSLKAGKLFVDAFLKRTAYNYRFYSAESTPEEQKELENVTESWKKLNLLMMTTTITVGINYDPKEAAEMYDRIYLYGCAASALPRDIAQCLMRCRNIRDNHLTYTLDERVFEYPVSGADNIRADLNAKRIRLSREHSLIQWSSAPKWAEENYIHNSQELADKVYGYKNVLTQYLTRSGYSITTETVKDVFMKSVDTELKYNEIEVIKDYTADDIETRIKHDMATVLEKRQLYKFSFLSALVPECHETAEEIWTKWISYETPREIQIAIASSDEEGKKILQKEEREKKKESKERETKFWNVVNEKHQSIEESMEFEAKGRFSGMTSRKANRRVLLQKMLSLFGMEHSCGGGSVEINGEIVEQMKSLESEIMSAFGEKSKSRRDTTQEFSQKNAIDLIKMVFEKWCDAEVTSESKKKQVNKVRTNVYTLTIDAVPLWDQITARRTVF